jgi:hypothetical protein
MTPFDVDGVDGAPKPSRPTPVNQNVAPAWQMGKPIAGDARTHAFINRRLP